MTDIWDMTQEQRIDYIQKALDEHGDMWTIAAMVDGSIGYHTPRHAKILIERFRRGDRIDYCERCIACFDDNLVNMMFCDIVRMEQLEPERREKLIAFCESLSKASDEIQGAYSMLYPTHHVR
jgi:hypothetical protein